MFPLKKNYIIAKDIDSKGNLKIKAKKNFGLKKEYFVGSP